MTFAFSNAIMHPHLSFDVYTRICFIDPFTQNASSLCHLYYPPAQRSWRGVYWIHLVRPSVCPSVCRRHGFRSISQVCFGISISNFICMLMVVIGRSLLIFSNVTFKMAAWRPYLIFLFPDSNFSLALNINFKLQRAHYLCIWVGAYWFSARSFSKWPPGGHIRFFGFWTL